MNDDGPVLNEDSDADEFETIVSDGRVDPPDAPLDAPPPADGPAPPEWAKAPRAPVPDPAKPGAELQGEDKSAASNAGRTLAARRQSIQEEINAETRRKHDAKREADYEEARLQQLRADAAQYRQPRQPERQPAPDPAAAQPQAEPQLESFENYELYTKAWGQWAKGEAVREARAIVAEERAQYRAEQQQSDQQRAQDQLLTAHSARVKQFRAEHADYDTLVSQAANLPTNDMMTAHFVNADTGPALMHYLAQHPDDCMRIAALPPGPTLVALGRIEARLEAATAGPAPKAPSRTFARPPIKPVGNGPVGVDGEPPGPDASLDEHADFYDRQEQARRSR